MLTPRPVFLAVLLIGWSSAARTLPAQAPLGQVAATYGFSASRLLTDPVRPRIYAAVPKTNSVAVIDTNTLQIVGTVFVGSNPVDLAISPDGNTLYTANRDSTTAAVGVVDLNTLQALPSLSLPGPAYTLAAGLDGRLYVSLLGPAPDGYGLFQVDSATGAVQAHIDTDAYTNDSLQISLDRKTLYSGGGAICSYDVSTPTPALLQTNGGPYDVNVLSLRLSHDGRTICRPSENEEIITVYSATDLNTYSGVLNEDGPGPLAFSADDSLIYVAPQTSGDIRALHVYSTKTFLQTASLQVPIGVSSTYDSYQVFDLTTDSTGSFLFISQTNDEVGGNIVVLTTGQGTLTPPNALPVVRITSDTPQISQGQGQHGRFTLTRDGDVSQPLTVTYNVGGTVSNGSTVKYLKGSKVFKAGHATAGINVTPMPYSFGYSLSGPLKLQLQPSGLYTIGKAKAKITLVP